MVHTEILGRTCAILKARNLILQFDGLKTLVTLFKLVLQLIIAKRKCVNKTKWRQNGWCSIIGMPINLKFFVKFMTTLPLLEKFVPKDAT